ncbi:MAG: hypothetical protein GY832_19275 [Chloroflexi bacterium]|nr:hypothetical protein [Chloroflexota bacterium]
MSHALLRATSTCGGSGMGSDDPGGSTTRLLLLLRLMRLLVVVAEVAALVVVLVGSLEDMFGFARSRRIESPPKKDCRHQLSSVVLSISLVNPIGHSL